MYNALNMNYWLSFLSLSPFQEYEESPSLIFGSSIPRGVILPHSSEELPVILLAKATGRLRHPLRIAVFGSVQPPSVSGSLCVCVCASECEHLCCYRLNTVCMWIFCLNTSTMFFSKLLSKFFSLIRLCSVLFCFRRWSCHVSGRDQLFMFIAHSWTLAQSRFWRTLVEPCTCQTSHLFQPILLLAWYKHTPSRHAQTNK